MATTVSAFSAIDDTEVDAESPITESLMTRMRDNSYWIIEGTNKTTETTTGKFLEPDGSNGVRWTTVDSSTILDGTKGVFTWSASIGSPNQIAIVTGGKLIITNGNFYGQIIIDASDDTWVGIADTVASSGALTGTYQSLCSVSGGGTLQGRKTGSNYEIYENGVTGSVYAVYLWL